MAVQPTLVRQERNIVENKVALIWPGHKLDIERRENRRGSGATKRRVRVGGNPKDSQGNLLRAVSRVNHCGLFNFPTNRNNDRSNVLTQYKT